MALEKNTDARPAHPRGASKTSDKLGKHISNNAYSTKGRNKSFFKKKQSNRKTGKGHEQRDDQTNKKKAE